MFQLCSDRLPFAGQVFIQIDNPVGRDRLGKTLGFDLSNRMALDDVFDMSISFIGNQNLIRQSRLFKTGSEIDPASDNRIVHAVLAAKIADGS